MRQLDFIVIGAQKSGTTSLFRYLQSHPHIYMPPDKEAPFFDREDRLQRGWEWYIDEFFSAAPQEAGVLWGTVTPQYFSDTSVPERIAKLMPSIKLVALLRNPIDRAFSHYRMAVRWGLETRTFSEAVNCSLMNQSLEQAGSIVDNTTTHQMTYLTSGEYGKLLACYSQYFDRRQILTLFTEDLATDPARCVQSVLNFLGLQGDFSPQNINRRYHVGGERKRIRGLEKIMNLGVWNALFPKRHRTATYWLRQWNTVAAPAAQGIDALTRQDLAAFYSVDVARLEADFGVSVPWVDWQEEEPKLIALLTAPGVGHGNENPAE